jgi:catalase
MSRPGKGIKGRSVAILMTDGFNYDEANELQNALAAEGAKGEFIATRIGAHESVEGETINVTKTFKTAASVLYDGVYIPSGDLSIQDLSMEADVIHFINEAFKHHKTIGYSKPAENIMQVTSIGSYHNDPGVVMHAEGSKIGPTFIKALKAHRHWDREIAHVPA